MSPHLLSHLLLLQLLLLLALLLTAARPDLHLLHFLSYLHLISSSSFSFYSSSTSFYSLSSSSFYSLSSSSSSSYSTSTLFSLSHHHPGLPLAPAMIGSAVQVSLRSNDSDWLLLRLL